MAKIIISFGSQAEAQQAISRLSRANVGEIRTRQLGQPGKMMSPELGSIDVRPEEIPQSPAAQNDGEGAQTSASIPNTGQNTPGVQMEIEVDDGNEDKVRRILGVWGDGMQAD